MILDNTEQNTKKLFNFYFSVFNRSNAPANTHLFHFIFILTRFTQVLTPHYFIFVSFTMLVKILIDSTYKRTIFLYKTCHRDFLVIKRQQKKQNKASCYPLCRYFDSYYFAFSMSLVQSADTRKPMRRNLNCT